MSKYINKIFQLENYNQIFQKAIHVEVGKWENIHYALPLTTPPLLGIKRSFYNCVAVHCIATNDKNNNFYKGLAHFNEPENSSTALHNMLAYYENLQEEGWDIQKEIILNITHASEALFGPKSADKQVVARNYCIDLLDKKNHPFTIRFVGTSGFAIDPDGNIIEKSFLKEELLRRISPKETKNLEQ